MSFINPNIHYSTYIPQQDDIENNIKTVLQSEIDEKIGKLCKRLDKHEEELKKFKEITDVLMGSRVWRCCDSIISIVLFVIIYAKVYGQ